MASTSNNSLYCTRFCCSDFNRFHDAKLRHQAGLTNEPIPLLSRERFPPYSDYRLLRSSCQLASLLLVSAPRFIVTISNGDLYVNTEKNSRGQRMTWAELDALRDANDKVYLPHIARFPTTTHDRLGEEYFQIRARQILNNLSCMVVFETHQPLPHGVRGMTQQLPGPLSPAQAKAFPRGVRSRIAISSKVYESLRSLTTAAQQKNHPSQSLLIMQFQLAKLLLHELGHALSNAVQGNTCYGETFHENCELAEMGYALENAVFGGVLDLNSTLFAGNYDLCSTAQQHDKGHKSGVKSNLALHAWPDGKTQYYYEKLGNKLFRSKRKLPPVTKVQRVDLQFLAQLFSHSYWTSNPQSEPLHLPTKGTWFDLISNDREIPCDLLSLAEGEYPHLELQHIIAQEIASGTRKPVPPLPSLPSPPSNSYKLLTPDTTIPAGELHPSIKLIPLASRYTGTSCGAKTRRRGRLFTWLSDNLVR